MNAGGGVPFTNAVVAQFTTPGDLTGVCSKLLSISQHFEPLYAAASLCWCCSFRCRRVEMDKKSKQKTKTPSTQVSP